MKLFAICNTIFLIVFIGIAIAQPAWWIWAGFALIWFVADYLIVVRTGFHLPWWGWAGLAVVLTVIDLVVLYATGAL